MSDDTEIEIEELPHLLVVDDSRLMRRAIGKILGKEYRITEAEDGEEAWTILQATESIRVIFSDLSMPKLDGFGLLEKIRNSDNPAINELPVIIITGADDDDETKHKALNNGASDFISKPFESVQLRTRAKTHVRLEQTHKKLNETASELEKQATSDRLTGLSNKKHFDARIVKDVSYAKRHRGELTLMFLEIHDFNRLFLKHGKEIADLILTGVTGICQSCTRNEDTLARVGLAKLAFILPSANRIGAKRLSERIYERINDLSIRSDKTVIPITTNIGIAAIDINNSTSVEDIINLADKHLQIAISQTGNSIVIDDQDTSEANVDEATEIAKDVIRKPEIPALSTLPDLETATQIAGSENAEQLHPYLSALLRKILPLLKMCNVKLELGIDDAILIIEKKIKNT